MYKSATIAVVVPAYNEETQIGRVIETMPDIVDSIVIVDDKSRDGTADRVRAYQKDNPRVVLVEHAVNQGVGGAIASGYKWARDNDIDIAVVMAGDGQMDPDDLPRIVEPVATGGFDYSKGNRLIYADAYTTIPKTRFFGNAILSLLTKIASGYWHIADSQTGYTAIGKRALAEIDWDRMYKRYGQPNDLLVTLNVHECRVKDVPVRPVYNVGEKSGIRIHKVVFTIGWLLFKRFMWRLGTKYLIRDFHPLILFYGLGMFLLAMSLILFVRLIVVWIAEGDAPDMTMMAMLFAFSIGLQSTFFAMWFDMITNQHLRVGEKSGDDK
ncbi:glycosyltransferase family 2 protein [Oceanibacterium hippocampi]|uniref:Undecaprenyl-phosphate mannosyltransferase n=1 Tax=Oceanibacterium hippocampi TaxID=745714 RepID=A0A1Y5RQA5_9PROT|nr:glycosyltransferase family 2 protein [Oceanibacterium hippocampi]SLN22882.1 Undecaprenyl-phosphate mannosyltransferase [Oceanibacterium hippocampi]